MRKIIAGILAMVMLLSLCSFAVAEQEPITVTVFRGDPGDQPTEDNKIYKMIEEQFGIKFEIEFLAGDLDETLGTKIAGEDYPDLFDGGNSAEKLINAGALIDLMPYITEEGTPNLYNHIKDLLPQLVNENGELFIIPNYGINYHEQIVNACNGPAFFIQKQVLAWDNYPQIKTLDQYFDLIERFIAANPTDENGAKYEGFAILCEDWRHFCLINPVQHLMGQPNEGEVYINRTADENGIYAVETFIDKDYAKLNTFKIDKRGSKVALIGLGSYYALAESAAAELAKQGIDASIINPRFATGIDCEVLDGLRADHQVVVTLENGVIDGGFGEKIARFYGNSDMRVLVKGLKKEFYDKVPYGELMERNRLTPKQIAEDVMATLK